MSLFAQRLALGGQSYERQLHSRLFATNSQKLLNSTDKLEDSVLSRSAVNMVILTVV